MGVEAVIAQLRAEEVTPNDTEKPVGVTASAGLKAAETLGFSGAVTPVTPVTPENSNVTPAPEPSPFEHCHACGGLDWWKPAALPLDGPGWRCVACNPPGDVLRHACAVPSNRN